MKKLKFAAGIYLFAVAFILMVSVSCQKASFFLQFTGVMVYHKCGCFDGIRKFCIEDGRIV